MNNSTPVEKNKKLPQKPPVHSMTSAHTFESTTTIILIGYLMSSTLVLAFSS